MAALSGTAPTLTFDTEELQRWGYIWRIGTKTRRGAREADEDVPEDDPAEGAEEADSVGTAQGDAAVPEASVEGAAEAIAGAVAEAVEAVAEGGETVATAAVAVRLNQPLTAAAAGLPAEWVDIVDEAKKYPSAFDKKQGMDFGSIFDKAVGSAFSSMLGNIPVVTLRSATTLLPSQPDCVEVGPARVIGGVRPQNFDVAYRPDGVRIAYDSKTLNDSASIQKNWQNMVNDLATEATTVHTRFPYAIVAFLVAVPKPALRKSQEVDLIRTLERLAMREYVIDQNHLAESLALVVWDPVTGQIDPDVPGPDSPLRYEKFMTKVHRCYVDRYKGLPPHDK